MATKVTVFGQEEQKKELKKIEFVKVLEPTGEFAKCDLTPSDYDNVECISKEKGKFDVFNAWYHKSTEKMIYLGHFNDGIV